MSKTVALVNMKGGVGKTTLAVNLAASASRASKRVLVVDLDPQANASVYLMGGPGYRQYVESNAGSIGDVFEQFTPVARQASSRISATAVIQPVRTWWARDKLDLLPSRLELAWTLKNPAGKELLLSRFLNREAADYDLILIDCPPTESMFTTAAYLASDYVLVPVVPEFLSAIGLPLLARSISDFKEQYENQSLEIVGIVFNSAREEYSEHARTKQYVRNTAAENDWYVFNTEISYSRSYPRGPRARTPIFRTDYARHEVRDRFQAFAAEFFGRIGE